MKKLLMMISISFLLTGCARTTDLEDRNYTLVLGIDKQENMIEATYSFANLATIAGRGGDESESVTLSIKGGSLKEIEESYKTFNDKTLELGHLKAIIIGEDLIQDETMKRDVLKEIQDSPQYTKTILFYTTEKSAKKMVELDGEIQGMLGDYLSNMFYNNLQTGQSKPVTIENILRSLNEDEMVMVPKLSFKEGKPCINAYDIFVGGERIQTISGNTYQILGLLEGRVPYESCWINGSAIEVLSVKSKGSNPVKISGSVKVTGAISKKEIDKEMAKRIKKELEKVSITDMEVQVDFQIQ